MFVLHIAMANDIKACVCFAYCDGKRYNTSAFLSLRLQTIYIFFFCVLRWQTLYNHCVLFVYCDGKRYTTNAFCYCDGRRYKTNAFFVNCDGKRYNTIVFSFIAMADVIKPTFVLCIPMEDDINQCAFCLFRWHALQHRCVCCLFRWQTL